MEQELKVRNENGEISVHGSIYLYNLHHLWWVLDSTVALVWCVVDKEGKVTQYRYNEEDAKEVAARVGGTAHKIQYPKFEEIDAIKIFECDVKKARKYRISHLIVCENYVKTVKITEESAHEFIEKNNLQDATVHEWHEIFKTHPFMILPD